MRNLRVGLVLLVAVLGLVFAGTAMAEDPPVIDQYQEPLPTGGGNHHTGGNGGNGGSGGTGGGSGGSGSGGGAELPNSTQSNLANSVSAPVAQALESVATSPDLGAPQGTIGKRDQAGSDTGSGSSFETPAVNVEPLSGSPLTDAISAATDGGNSHLVAVVLALAALTLGGGLAAAARRRQTG